ncbi:MAG: hypothetical protein KTV77_01225 [Wolbachia endosymbiont of Fragariocoptes setiger]|nr:hypothetical protein [Wolbachia endosymbiont of Fragariocoptes setiger]
MKIFKKRKIKSYKNDKKSTSEIGFNKEKILKMTRLCIIASNCNNLKPNNISDDGIIKPDYNSIKEEMKRIRKESDQEFRIFDIIESKDNTNF